MYIRTQRAFVLLFIILGVGCATTENGGVKSFNLKTKECFRAFESQANLCLDSVYGDSRCPQNLVCIWEGDALAAFTLTTTNATKKFILHANKKFQTDTLIEGFNIKLLNITPYPVADEQIGGSTYAVEITVNDKSI